MDLGAAVPRLLHDPWGVEITGRKSTGGVRGVMSSTVIITCRLRHDRGSLDMSASVLNLAPGPVCPRVFIEIRGGGVEAALQETRYIDNLVVLMALDSGTGGAFPTRERFSTPRQNVFFIAAFVLCFCTTNASLVYFG